jgi:hypothetical protein
VVGAILALIVVSARSARAQTAPDDRETAAREACAAGRYQKGVELLAALFAQTGEAIYVYNQARCFEENNRLEEAIGRFREYVRKMEGTPEAATEVPPVEARIKALEDRLSSQRATAALALSTTTASPVERPIHRRAWFWVAVGAVVVGSATAILLATRSSSSSPFCPDCTLMSTGVPAR